MIKNIGLRQAAYVINRNILLLCVLQGVIGSTLTMAAKGDAGRALVYHSSISFVHTSLRVGGIQTLYRIGMVENIIISGFMLARPKGGLILAGEHQLQANGRSCLAATQDGKSGIGVKTKSSAGLKYSIPHLDQIIDQCLKNHFFTGGGGGVKIAVAGKTADQIGFQKIAPFC